MNVNTTPSIKALEACGLRLKYRNYLTDAASQLVCSDGGNWSGSDLRGKAGEYAGHYVRRRRSLAAQATSLGLGRLVQLDGRSHNRIVWEWADDAMDIANQIAADAIAEEREITDKAA